MFVFKLLKTFLWLQKLALIVISIDWTNELTIDRDSCKSLSKKALIIYLSVYLLKNI